MVQSLTQLLRLMQAQGVTRVYAKKLSPNDNSKNQIYLGGDFSALNIIPHGEIYTDRESIAGSKRDRAKAKVSFFWLDEDGIYPAPDVTLILYPKYPEVRMSGFLFHCRKAPSDILRVRDSGRILVLGISSTNKVFGYAASPTSPVAAEIEAGKWEKQSVFLKLPLYLEQSQDSKQLLLTALKCVHEKGWIPSQKLCADGTKKPYTAQNGGGYTLEAELDISPNGYSEPDFMGWEVKQYGVKNFISFLPKSPVTLMTPEPTGGMYKEKGVPEFLQKYGYRDKGGRENRINFGGIYTCEKDFHPDTCLKIKLEGYDSQKGKITNLDGYISLHDRNDEVAAAWSFKNMMEHWNRKHAQAAYIPSLTEGSGYFYGNKILLCEQTDFLLFLKAFAIGIVYYDPAVKIEYHSNNNGKVKRRNQFRIKHQNITYMYHQSEEIDLNKISF